MFSVQATAVVLFPIQAGILSEFRFPQLGRMAKQMEQTRISAALTVRGCLCLLALSQISQIAIAAEEIVVGECKTSYQNRVTYAIDHPGLIASVPAEGDLIRETDVVIQLQNEVQQANLALATERANDQTQIRVEQKAAESAKLEYDSALEANRLAGGNIPAYPPLHITRLRLAYEAAELKVKVAEQAQRIHELARDQAQAELNSFRIVAGLDGTVVQVFKHAGEAVQQGEPIVELVNLKQLRVEGFVSQQDSSKIQPGMPVLVTFELSREAEDQPELRHVQGKLAFVDASVSTLSNRVRVWAVLENTDHELQEGLSVGMRIPLDSPD